MLAAEAEAEAMLAAEAKRESMLAAKAEGDSMLAAEAAGESMLASNAEGESILAAKAEGGGSILAAEADSMLAAEADSMLAAEADSILAEKVKAERRRCRFRDCRCCWDSSPSGRVAPGIDYVCPPDPDADAADQHLPAWSLLIGVADGESSSLRVSRLRVARSGRILGQSDDALEVFHNIRLAKPPRYSFQAGVAPLASDGGSLCVLHHELREQPQARQLNLQPQAESKESPLPKIEDTTTHCMPISADGHVWALSAFTTIGITKLLSVVTRRLVPASGRWELVGDTFTGRIKHGPLAPWSGSLLQGYAVIPDAKLILVSFQQYGLFLTFAPDSGSWTRVLTDTDETRSQRYLPIVGRGIYVEQHKAVYMLTENTIFAYKLTYQKDGQLKLDLPIEMDYVCPFKPSQGYGFLTSLAGPRMCSVWISLAQRVPCPCDHLHAIVTTFDLPTQGGIKVLHSTYRRVDMQPNPPEEQKFCFLQEYEDQGSPVLQQRGEEQEDLTSSHRVDDPAKLLTCCRIKLEMRREPSCSLPVDPASRQHQVCSTSPAVPVKRATTIKNDLIIICQAGSQPVIYRTGAMGDDIKPLKPCYVAVGDRDWHFFLNGPKIEAVSSIRASMLEFSLKDQRIFDRPVSRPRAGPIVMVIRVGQETIALTETLQVYHLKQFNYRSTMSWLRYTADELEVDGKRVDISGYVALDDDSFIVCDAVTCSCLRFDLRARQWSVVMPLDALKEDPPTPGLLNGRCVSVDGFIYTCRKGGLAAYELLRVDHCVYLSKPTFLPLSRSAHCVGEDMCLDYAGKDVDSGANLFYVVQGVYSPPKRGGRTTTFSITTVKVKTERTASNKMKLVGIDNMDSVTRVIHHAGAMDLRCCFAV